MKKKMQISPVEAKQIGESLHIDWNQVDLEQFRQGLMENLEPVTLDPATGSSFDGVLLTGKVVLAHMQEFPDYFDRLAKLEAEVNEYQARRR
jgi:sensor domain CHASE-containing protein